MEHPEVSQMLRDAMRHLSKTAAWDARLRVTARLVVWGLGTIAAAVAVSY